VDGHRVRAVTAPAESPPARRHSPPRWADLRLILGVVLVLGCVVVGSRVVAGAERLAPVWAADRDLVAGTRLQPGDLRRVDVRLGAASARYLAVGGSDPAGAVLGRALAAGELLPVAALAPGGAGDPVVLVTLPVESSHLPPGLARGDAVDVYVTAGAQSPAGAPRRVLALVPVDSVDGGAARLGGAGGSVAVVLAVPDPEVADLLAALRSGAVDLVQVPAR
jgi:hypothetical protein